MGAPPARIAILAPMRSELRPLVAPLGLAAPRAQEPGVRRGRLGRVEVVAGLTGMGLRAGAAAAERILDLATPDHLLVVGIAGGIGASVSVGDLVVPERVVHLATGESFEPARLGDAPRRGTLASSDRLLEDPEQAAKLADRGIVAIDMETAAIAAVCARRGCPWSVFRGISDRADDGSTDAAILGLADAAGDPKPGAVLRFVLTRPGRIPQLVRLARGASQAARVAAEQAVAAIGAFGEEAAPRAD